MRYNIAIILGELKKLDYHRENLKINGDKHRGGDPPSGGVGIMSIGKSVAKTEVVDE